MGVASRNSLWGHPCWWLFCERPIAKEPAAVNSAVSSTPSLCACISAKGGWFVYDNLVSVEVPTTGFPLRQNTQGSPPQTVPVIPLAPVPPIGPVHPVYPCGPRINLLRNSAAVISTRVDGPFGPVEMKCLAIQVFLYTFQTKFIGAISFVAECSHLTTNGNCHYHVLTVVFLVRFFFLQISNVFLLRPHPSVGHYLCIHWCII